MPEKAAAHLDFPVLVIHGEADTRVSVENGVRVHAAAHRDSELWLVPDVDHADAFRERSDDYEDRVVAYFEARLASQ